MGEKNDMNIEHTLCGTTIGVQCTCQCWEIQSLGRVVVFFLGSQIGLVNCIMRKVLKQHLHLKSDDW